MGTTVQSLLALVVLRRNSLNQTRITMAELGLKKKEVDAIEFAFDVYDFKGDGKVDAFYAGDLIRACNLNTTLKTIAEVGGTTEKGQKMLTKADVFPMYKACKDSKEEAKSLMKELLNPLTMKDSCPSSPSLRECALLRSNFLNSSTNTPVPATQHQIIEILLFLYIQTSLLPNRRRNSLNT